MYLYSGIKASNTRWRWAETLYCNTELKKITQIFAMLSFLAFGYNGNIENQIHVKT